MEFKSFKLEVENHIAVLSFNRPEKANSLDIASWEEMQKAFEYLADDSSTRVIVLRGTGKHFCAGIDLNDLMSLPASMGNGCPGKEREKLRKFIIKLQNTITAIEDCRKPVIAAIQNACVGGGVNIISACDMRFCTDDAYFSIKEVDLGLVADIGALQRLPQILNPGILAEMAYTGRKVSGPEAAKIGLVNRTFGSYDEMLDKVMEVAKQIAGKSPLVIRGTKEILLYSRDHSVKDSLDFVATWNAGLLISNDLKEAMQSQIMKKKPQFED